MRLKLIILFTLSLFINTAHKSSAQVVINEILSSNTSTNLDGYSKNFLDWVELYNINDKEVSIGDWYLSDDRTKPTKWKIPFYTSIAPKGFKLFWLDDMNISNHTNFKLNIEGESVYLFNKDTLLVDSIQYPPQEPDISYGRMSDSINHFMYFNEATPMKKNCSYGVQKVIYPSDPVFSHSSGFYDKTIKLKFSNNSDQNEIYYTIDGSIPTQTSMQYKIPIEISHNTVIRARTYHENKLPGKVVTQTYFINDSCSLPVISLVIDPEYLWDKNIGIYVRGINYREDVWESANYFQSWERPVNVEYFDIYGKSGFNINAGVRIHGRSSRNNPQKSLAVFTREKCGTSEITYKLFGESSSDTIKSFLLRNGGNDWGMTMFLDGLVHTLVIDKFDIDAQLYQPAIVFLNGEYWGIHNIREKINKHYIKAKYDYDSTKFDIIETDRLVGKVVASCGNFDEYNKLITFIENNELSIKENYDSVKKWIDTNEFIDYLTVQVYVCNKDWPNSNMKFWKPRDSSGKWRWILYDTELSFNKSNEYFNFNMLEHMFAVDSKFYPTASWSNYLIRKLFENDEFKTEFIQRMAVYLCTVFDSDRVLYVLDSLKRNIEPEIQRNLNKWGGIHQNAVPYLVTSSTETEWEANINFISDFIKNRPEVVRKNMIDYFNLSDTVNLRVCVNDINAGKVCLMGYEIDNSCFEGTIFAGIPIHLEAIPNEGYEFVKWKGEDSPNEILLNLNKNKKLTAVFKKVE